MDRDKIRRGVQVLAAGLGAAVAGPLGGFLGGFLGDALTGSGVLAKYAEKFGEEGAKKLLDLGTDSISEKLKTASPDLAALYRETLRESLADIRPSAGQPFTDWFDDWNECLRAGVLLDLQEIHPDKLDVAQLDDIFRQTMERLDAQGDAIRHGSLSIHLRTREAPEQLLADLKAKLPDRFKENFQKLASSEDYKQAWAQTQMVFDDWLRASVSNIGARTERIDARTERIEDKMDTLLAAKQSSSAASVPFQAPPIPSYFVSRPELSNPIRQRLLTRSNAAGVRRLLAIRGLGGSGKSTIAAALAWDPEVREHFRDGVLWVTLSQQPETLTLLNQWLGAFGNPDVSKEAAASDRLRALLQSKSVLMVVDDVWDGEVAQLFLVGGPDCAMLITTRESLPVVQTNVGREDLFDIDVMTETQALDLLRSGLGRPIQGDEFREAARVANAVGYLPLALQLAAVQVRDGLTWVELISDLNNEVTRLETLDAPASWEAKSENARKGVSLAWSLNLSLRRLPEQERRRFAWFGALAEDAVVTPAAMATVWETGLDEARRSLRLLQWKALLQLAPLADGIATYRIHDLMRDLAVRVLSFPPVPKEDGDLVGFGLTIQEAHRAVVERYRTRRPKDLWHALPDDGYVRAHLVWHLQQAGMYEEIHALLGESTTQGRNGWYEAREQLGQTTGYLTDLSRAWQLADGGAPRQQVLYALMTSSVNTLVRNVLPQLSAALVKKGVWTPTQGLANARNLEDDDPHKAETIASLAPYLPEALLRDALGLLQPMPGKNILQALLAIPAAVPQLVLPDAWRLSWNIPEPESRQAALERLAPQLSVPLLQDSLELAKASSETDRAQLMGILAPYLPERLLGDAWGMACAVSDVSLRAEAEFKLALYLPEEVLRSAIESIEKAPSAGENLAVLTALTVRLASLGKPQEALEHARKIESPVLRVQALQNCALCFPEGDRASLVAEIGAVIQTITKTSELTYALASLDPELPPPAAVLEHLVPLAHAIDDPWEKGDALLEIAKLLPADVREDLVRESFLAARIVKKIPNGTSYRSIEYLFRTYVPLMSGKLLDEALEVWWSALRDEWSRVLDKTFVEALAMVLDRLSPSQMQAAVERAEGLKDPWVRVRILGILMPYIKNRAEEMLTVANNLGDPAQRAQLMIAVAGQLDAPSRERIAPDLVNALGTIQDNVEKAVSLLPTKYMERALDIVETIDLNSQLASALAALAPQLTRPLVERALNMAARLDKSSREIALGALAVRVGELGTVGEALRLIQSISHSKQRSETIENLVLRLVALGRELDALQASRAILDQAEQIDVLLALAPKLSTALLGQLVARISAIADSHDQAKAVATLTPVLPSSMLGEALRLISESSQKRERNSRMELGSVRMDTDDPAETLSKVAPRLSAELLPEALQVATSMPDTGSFGRSPRSQALAALAPYLSAPLLSEAIDAARKIQDPRSASYALQNLAVRVAEQGRVNDAMQLSIGEWDSFYRDDSKGDSEENRARAGLSIGFLIALASYLSESQVEENLATCLEGIKPQYRAQYSGKLAVQLAKNKRCALALKIGGKIADPKERAICLLELSALVEEGDRAAMQANAVEIARSLADASTRADILLEAIRADPGDLAAMLAGEAWEALKNVGDPTWPQLEARKALEVARYLPADQKKQAIEYALKRAERDVILPIARAFVELGDASGALQVIRDIPDESIRATALVGIADHLPAQSVTVAISMVERFKSGFLRPLTLALMGFLDPGTPGKEVIEAAIAAVQGAPEPSRLGWEEIRNRSALVIAFAGRLASQGKISEAIQLVGLIENKGDRAGAWEQVLPHIADLGVESLGVNWRTALHTAATRDREHLLSDLAALSPIFGNMGQGDFGDDTARDICQVSEWWP